LNTGWGSDIIVLIEAGGFYSRKYGICGKKQTNRDGDPDPPWEGAIWGKEEPIVSIGIFCCEVCKNG